MLDADQTALAVIDVQGKLVGLVHEHQTVLPCIHQFIRACEAFDLPVLWTEQAPHKIGQSVESIKELLSAKNKPIHKQSISCYAEPQFVDELRRINRCQILVIGIETHACIYQTARDLHAHGYQVHVIADAVSSRRACDHHLAIARMRQEGIIITSMEMAICELLKTADHPKFKDIIAHIKR